MKRKVLSILILAILVFTISGIANFSFAAEKTLNEKINDATDGETITLDSDYAEKIVIPEGKNITLNLNGKKVTPYGITVENGATVKITGNGTVDAQEASTAALYVKDGGNATVENGKFNSDKSYCVLNKGTTVINNGTFSQGEGNKKVNSSLIENGYYSGSPSIVKKAKLTINGGTFDQSYSTTSTVKSDSYGDTTITGGTFNSKNGITSIQVTGNVTVTGGKFVNEDGGFISIYGTKGTESDPGTVKISGGEVNAKTLIPVSSKCFDFGKATITNGVFKINEIDSSLTLESLEIQGGSFTKDPSKFINNGYNVKTSKDGKFEVAKNEVVTNTDNITIDTSKSVEKVTVGVSKEDQAKLIKTLGDLSQTGSSAIQKELANDKGDLEAVINTNDLKEEQVNKTVLESINEVASDKKLTVSQYLDISVVVMNKSDNKVVDTVTETKDPITFTVMLPNDLLKDGRKFYILRNHDGETTVLDTKQDENKLTFETDKFSTYVVAYTDATDSTDNTNTTDNTSTTDSTNKKDTSNSNELDETPKTGIRVASPIVFLLILATISAAGILIFKNKK